MIHAIHLLWIVPLAGGIGFVAATLLVANKINCENCPSCVVDNTLPNEGDSPSYVYKEG